jgi:fatty acid desaturase
MLTSNDGHRRSESAHLAHDLERALDEAANAHVSRRDVPRELLAPATTAGLLRMTFEEWMMILVLWSAMIAMPSWTYVVLALLLAGRLHALGVVLHDATHLPLRRKTFGIRVIEVFCGYPIATTLNAMRYHHLRHHRDSGMPTDPYYKAGSQTAAWFALNVLRGLALVPFWTARAFVGALASIAPPLRNVYAHLFLQDRTAADLRRSPEVIECARAEWGQVLCQCLIAALAIERPAAVLWGYVVPVSLAGLLAARRVLIEHNYERVADRDIATIMRTTNDNHLGVLGALGLAPRNIGFHIVHHIHPQVRLGALPRLRDWYRRTHPQLYQPPDA